MVENSIAGRAEACSLPGAGRAGFEFGAGMPPARLFVDSAAGDVPEAADHRPVQARHGRGDVRNGWFIHERHELVREAGHRAADADSADVRAATNAVDPAALRHVAFHDRAPTAELHNAFRRPVLGREITLLVVTGSVT